MFFKKESHNLLLIFGIAFVILCMCKKKVSGFETNDHLDEINEYFSSIRSIQAELNLQIDEFENFIQRRPGWQPRVRDTATREDTENSIREDTATSSRAAVATAARATAQSPPPAPVPAPPPVPAPAPVPAPTPAPAPAPTGGALTALLDWARGWGD
jgi:hypothetical protein